MAYDFNTLIRRLSSNQANTTPASGGGLLGLGATTGGSGSGGALSPSGGGLNPNYTPTRLQPLPSSDPADYKSVDDMTFDNQYQTNWDALQRRLVDAQSSYDLANQQDTEDYQRALREAGEQRDLDQQGLLDRLANQGILRSGIQVKASSDLGNAYQNRINEFDRMRTQAQTERENAYTQMKRDVQDQLAGLQAEKASRQAAIEREIAQRQAEAQAQNNEILNGNQPQPTSYGYFLPGMGFGGQRTVVGGAQPIGSTIGVPEGPSNVLQPGMGLKGATPDNPIGGGGGGIDPRIATAPPEVKAYLSYLASIGR